MFLPLLPKVALLTLVQPYPEMLSKTVPTVHPPPAPPLVEYDDSKRKSVPLVPEEMKVNKSSNPEDTMTESNDDAPRPLSREDIRNARLAALEKRMAASKSHDNEGDEDSNVDASSGKK